MAGDFPVRAAIAGALSITLVVAACSSGKANTATNTATKSTTQSPGAASGTAPATASTTASTTAAISHAYAVFFGANSTVDQSVAVLQNGERFQAALAAQNSASQQQKLSAKVTKVVLRSAHVADVTFTLYGGGSPLLPGASGLAVDDGGTWKVAAQTYCSLVQLQGAAPKQCSDTSLLQLPS